MNTSACERRLTAPDSLGLETRNDFRAAAVTLLEEMPEGLGRLVVDLGSTSRVDSAGLGALMLVQRRAMERRQVVSLEHASDEIRWLLVLTKLVDLFEMR
jgi:ABC-type transporter Mla MlaB component